MKKSTKAFDENEIGKINKSTAAAALAKQRKIVKGFCNHCGNEIEGVKTKKYCDDLCKQKAYYERNKDVDDDQ